MNSLADKLPHTLGELYKAMKMTMSEAGILTAELDARLILNERCDIGWGEIIAKPEYIIAADNMAMIADDLAQRLNGKPLSKIYRKREFWGLEFEVSDDVLDPRPDTETIIDIALQRFPKDADIRILDMGTGTGCILIALLKEFPNAQGLAVDISVQALEIARRNATKHEVGRRAKFMLSDWFSSLREGDAFDLIVSNPPYIRESVIPDLEAEVRNYDPILALDGGTDGLQAYKTIFSSFCLHLNTGGTGLFEIGYDQCEELMRLGRESRFSVINVHPDLAGQPRVVEICCGDK